MKKLTIIATAVLLMLQITVQAQVSTQGNHRNLQHNSAQNIFKQGCGTPGSIFVDEITGTSATIHWNTNGAMQYKIMYVNTDNNQERGVLMTPLGSVAVDNLTPCNNYKFVIYSKCASGIYKSNPQMFSTLGCK